MNIFNYDLITPKLEVSLLDLNNDNSRTAFNVPFGSEIESYLVDVPWKDENLDEGIKNTIKLHFKPTTSLNKYVTIGKWNPKDDFSFILEDLHSVKFECNYRTDNANLSGSYQIINPGGDLYLAVIYKAKWINKQAIEFYTEARNALFGLMIWLEYRNIYLPLLS